jgi:hypothetical protein
MKNAFFLALCLWSLLACDKAKPDDVGATNELRAPVAPPPTKTLGGATGTSGAAKPLPTNARGGVIDDSVKPLPTNARGGVIDDSVKPLPTNARGGVIDDSVKPAPRP